MKMMILYIHVHAYIYVIFFSKNGFETVRICRTLWRLIFFGPNDFLYSLKVDVYQFYKTNRVFMFLYISYKKSVLGTAFDNQIN